jgi:hypothetical protein
MSPRGPQQIVAEAGGRSAQPSQQPASGSTRTPSYYSNSYDYNSPVSSTTPELATRPMAASTTVQPSPHWLR